MKVKSIEIFVNILNTHDNENFIITVLFQNNLLIWKVLNDYFKYILDLIVYERVERD